MTTQDLPAQSPALLRAIEVVGLIILTVLCLAWAWSHQLGTLHSDDMVYLLMAEHFSPWSEGSAAAAHATRHSPFPPLFPILLGLFNAGTDVLRAHLITAGILVVALAVFNRWLVIDGLTRWWALALTAVVAVLPGTYMHALWIFSEPVYLLLSLAALAAVAVWQRRGEPRALWAAAPLVAASVLTRSAGISLLVAFVGFLLLHRPSQWKPLIIVATIPSLLWGVARIVTPDTDGISYLALLGEHYATNPFTSVFGQIHTNVNAMIVALSENLGLSRNTRHAGMILAAIVFGGALFRASRRNLDGFYVIAYILVILMWPAPSEMQRFVFVILPILVYQGFDLITALSQRLPRVARFEPLRIVFAGALLLPAMPFLAVMTTRATQSAPAELAPYRTTAFWYGWYVWHDMSERPRDMLLAKIYADELTAIGPRIPANDCIYSVKTSFVHFYAKRISKVPPAASLDSKSFVEAVRAGGCHYFFFTFLTSPAVSRERFYPQQRLGDSIQTLKEMWVREGSDVIRVGVIARLKEAEPSAAMSPEAQ